MIALFVAIVSEGRPSLRHHQPSFRYIPWQSLGLGHSSFESEQKLIVEVDRIVATILVDEQSAGQGANLEHPVPVAAGTRQAGSLQSEDSADFFQGDIGRQGLEILALVGLGTGQAQVLIQHADLVALPARFRAPSFRAYCLAVLSW
jgi:hypothetical protein